MTQPPSEGAIRLPSSGFTSSSPASPVTGPAEVDLSLPTGGRPSSDGTDGDDGLFDSPFGFALIPVTFALGRVSRALRSGR